jgi:RHS repeat-associated protein
VRAGAGPADVTGGRWIRNALGEGWRAGPSSVWIRPTPGDNLRSINQQGANWLTALCNGDGLRITKTDPWSPYHHYTWGLGGVLVDSNDMQPPGTPLNTLIYTPGVSQNVNGTDRFFHTDWLGSTRYLSDATGNSFPSALRYDAFGEVTSPQGLQPPTYYQFAGDWGYQAEWSASYEIGLGLDYLRGRYYDPAIGRFISPDPLSFASGSHLYRYVANDPVNGADPLGLRGLEDEEIPTNGKAFFRQGLKQFAASPDLQPGSKQRVGYSRFLDTLPGIGQLKLLWQTITGRDPVGGKRVSKSSRFVGLCFLAVSSGVLDRVPVAENLNKLKSLLARGRGADWGVTGNPNEIQDVQALAAAYANHLEHADEVWRAKYRGDEMLFHIIEDRVVVTDLKGKFVSAWRATAAQLNHYRTGVRLR